MGCLVIENDVHGRGESQMSGKEVHSSSPTPAIPQGVSFPDSRLGAGWGVGLGGGLPDLYVALFLENTA